MGERKRTAARVGAALLDPATRQGAARLNAAVAPSALVSSRNPSKNSCVGRMKPELPTTGSRITPAISPLLAAKIAFAASKSLYSHTSVGAVDPAGTPGESGRPRVATPEPAWTRKASAWPW